MTVTSRVIWFRLSSNNTPWSPQYSVGSKIKALPEETFNGELSAGIGHNYTYYPLVVDDDLNMGDMSGGNFLWTTTLSLTVLWFQ